MELKCNKKTVLVLDLDDTLYYEADYAVSGFNAVANMFSGDLKQSVHQNLMYAWSFGMQPFDYLKSKHDTLPFSINEMLEVYRNHIPSIHFREGAAELIKTGKLLCGRMVLITDGRSNSQRNKIKALQIENVFDQIYISGETGFGKKDPETYDDLNQKYPGYHFIFVGDNPRKDFFQPLRHGWQCMGIRNDGRHIHSQDEELIKQVPSVTFVHRLSEIILKNED